MPRKLLPIALLLAALAPSCTEKISEQEGAAALREMTFTAGFCDEDSDPSVKTSVGEISGTTRQILWDEYDKISIFPVRNATDNWNFSLKSGAGTSQGVFSGFGDGTPLYYAVYPWASSAYLNYSYENGSKICMHWDGSAQTPTEGSFDPSVALLAGSTTGTSFYFRHVCSYIKLTTDFSCKKIEINSPDCNLSSDDIEITFDSDGKPVLSKVTATQPETYTGAAIVAPDNETIAPGTYYIAVLPASIYDFDLVVTTTGGKTLKRSVRFWSSFKAGRILNLGEISCSKFTTEVNGFLGGGTLTDPYLIGNKAQFDFFCTSLNGSSSSSYSSKYYRQTVDLDLGGETVGIKNTFSGSYDGDGHKLTNLTLKKQSVSCPEEDDSCVAALFASINGARISNLTVEAAGFESNTGADMMIYGGIAGVALKKNTFRNCTFSAYGGASNVSVGEKPVVFGGIVGYDSGTLDCLNCTNDYPISIITGRSSGVSGAKYAFGGIVGKLHNDSGSDCPCNLDRCRNNASVNISGAPAECYCGGLVGWVDEYATIDDVTLRILNCVNKGYVAAGSATVSYDTASGGLVGYHDSDGDSTSPLLFNSINCGGVSGGGGTAYVGGLMGWCYDNDTRVCACANVGNSYTDDSCAESPRCGALCGNAEGEYYYCAYTSGNITYGRYTTDSHVHNAYDIDGNGKQLSAETMNSLLGSVSSSLRSEALAVCTSFATWTGTWVSGGDQFGLDLDF